MILKNKKLKSLLCVIFLLSISQQLAAEAHNSTQSMTHKCKAKCSYNASALEKISPTHFIMSEPKRLPLSSSKCKWSHQDKTFLLDRKRLSEVSGLAYSSEHKVLYWVNDSGNKEDIYVSDLEIQNLKKVTLPGANFYDVEALSYASCDLGSSEMCLYISDSGNNLLKNKKVTVYKVKEDFLMKQYKSKKSNSEAINKYKADNKILNSGSEETVKGYKELVYKLPYRGQDIEAFAVNPKTLDFYFLTKESQENENSYKNHIVSKDQYKEANEFIQFINLEKKFGVSHVYSVKNNAEQGSDMTYNGYIDFIKIPGEHGAFSNMPTDLSFDLQSSKALILTYSQTFELSTDELTTSAPLNSKGPMWDDEDFRIKLKKVIPAQLPSLMQQEALTYMGSDQVIYASEKLGFIPPAALKAKRSCRGEL